MKPLVTVYVTSHNYAKYCGGAIDSVLAQTYKNLEVIIFDDNSTDDSREVISRYSHHKNVKTIFSDETNGLRKASNICIRKAKGEFVMRLDADDRLHENCIEVMVSKIRRSHGDLDFIFSDYYYLKGDAHKASGLESIKTVNGVYEAKSMPPHGACCLIRKEVFEKYGFYDETIRRQDGHELWIKVLRNSLIFAHVDLPLWYYRKHGDSLSSNNELLIEDRRKLKNKLSHGNVLAVAYIPILKSIFDVFDPISSGRIMELVGEVQRSERFSDVIVSTDSRRILDYCKSKDFGCHDRSKLSGACRSDIFRSLEDLITSNGYHNSVICIINLTSMRVNSEHFSELIDTYELYEPDSVISVYPENGIMYKEGSFGLQPINYDSQFQIRRDRDVIYVFSGALRLFKAKNLLEGRPFGEKIAHIEMSNRDSFIVKTAEQAKRYYKGDHCD